MEGSGMHSHFGRNKNGLEAIYLQGWFDGLRSDKDMEAAVALKI